MKFTTIFLILSILILSSYVLYRSKEDLSIQLVGKVQKATALSMQKKYPVNTSGTGVGMPGGIIEEIILSFDTKNPFSELEVLKFLTDAAQELTKQVNMNEEIQSFLKKRPFTINEANIILHNKSTDGISMIDPEITSAGIAQGMISYYSVDSIESFKVTKRGKMNYEEALQLINDSKNQNR